jgi:hypothetical protein
MRITFHGNIRGFVENEGLKFHGMNGSLDRTI